MNNIICYDVDQTADRPIICFSHLRWDFVYQRPQHLMERFARTQRVFYWEEPVFDSESGSERIEQRAVGESQVTVITPHLSGRHDADDVEMRLAVMLDQFMTTSRIVSPVMWYYTPMMIGFSRAAQADASAVVYDCMDELANFKFAPPSLQARERELMERADVVFTGGFSLYEAKRDAHRNIHPFPSSVDQAHFAKARSGLTDPADQAALSRPRFGFYGVVDERFDLELTAKLAAARPDWSIVIVGPVVKIDQASLPQAPNLRYLGGKSYGELPAYLSGWDVAIMPFAINESTRFISPTKTPEYLAGGRPVVSTAIVDVRRDYGELKGVSVCDDHAAFITACDRALALSSGPQQAWLPGVDAALADLSWDRTQAEMAKLVERVHVPPKLISPKRAASPIVAPAVWPAQRASHYDALIVGAGFAGSVMAERLATEQNKRVLVIDKRPHVAGNAYDAPDAAGVQHHVYGPHIFHTNSDEVFRYLSRFTDWRGYEHRVLAEVKGRLVPMPINRTTLNRLYDLNLRTDEDAAAFLAARAEPVPVIRTSEDVVVAAVGRELYETFFRGYTRKQWGLDPSELDRSVTSRVPTRVDTDDRYFMDKHQAMPKQGFTAMFERMLGHPNITVSTGVTYQDVVDDLLFDRLVFCGPVDEFFGHRFGELPYRSLRFEHETLDCEQFQPVAVVNYPAEETPYTRITEYKHLTGQVHRKTSITREYPSAVGDPYYPIPNAEAQALYKRYEALALARPDVDFVGRLATYKYYNMDQVVGQALAKVRKASASDKVAPSFREVGPATAL